jgi:CRP/FNR family transcriptional regulator
MGWAADSFPGLDQAEVARLEALHVADIPSGTALFHPGETPQGFAVVLAGRIDVHLIGPSGREILLYSVEPGQSCVQTTLGLMGDEPYSGEAVAATACRVVMIPAALFRRLMDENAGFRHYVFRAFATRMADMTHVLERVAFARVEARLAQALLDLAVDGAVTATQTDLAARIGSAREVISRRLDGFTRKGWVTTDRGRVDLTNIGALKRLAQGTV